MNAQDVLHLIVRDRRQAGHYRLDNEIMAEWYPIIREHGLTFYNVLALLAEDGKECAYPGLNLLTEYLGWSRSTVTNYRQLLEWCELIAVDSGSSRRSNAYYLLSVPHVSQERLTAIAGRVRSGWPESSKLRAAVLERINGWQPITKFFAARRAVVVEKEQGSLPGMECIPSVPQRAPSVPQRAPSVPQGISSVPQSISSVPDQQALSQLHAEQQEEQEATAITGPATVAYVSRDVADALSFLGILESQHEKIAAGWLAERGEAITVADVTAWGEYVRKTNGARMDSRQHLRPGFIVDNLKRGNLAPKERRQERDYVLWDDSDVSDVAPARVEAAFVPPAADPYAGPIWSGLLTELQLSLQRATFDSWLRDTQAIAYEDGCFVVAVKNAFAQDWLDQRMRGMITQRLQRQTGQAADVRFVVPG